MHVDERAYGWVYPATAIVALLLTFLLPRARARLPPGARRGYFWLQIITLLGAIVGAKLAMLAGDLGWPRAPVTLEHALFSGKSLLGGLLGGFLAAEVAKPFFGWRQPPNDWFATKLLVSIAIGRVGCVLAGCCRGLPTTSQLALVYSDDVPRVPVAAFEIAFHLALFGVFVWLGRRGRLRGRLFALYLVLYGVLRFALEPLRETPKTMASFSTYQLLAACTVLAGVWALARRLPEPEEARA